MVVNAKEQHRNTNANLKQDGQDVDGSYNPQERWHFEEEALVDVQ